jgi:hypothetical protein
MPFLLDCRRLDILILLAFWIGSVGWSGTMRRARSTEKLDAEGGRAGMKMAAACLMGGISVIS